MAGFETARVAPGFIDGPPPPIAPEVIRRDEQRRATLRAVEQPEGIRLDGQLDERVYYTVPAITGFIQQAPDEGAPATEKTEAWILFDADNIYVAARVWDSAPPSQWVANEMRRDTRQLRQNDTFAVILDTFYDRRNAVAFYTNPLGAIADFQITNEGNPNSDWNPVWDVRAGALRGRLDGGDGDPVQVAALPAGTVPDLGRAAPAQCAAQERVELHHAAAHLGRVRTRRDLPRLRRRDAGRARRPERQQEPGDQAVRHRRRQHQPRRLAADSQRRRRETAAST